MNHHRSRTRIVFLDWLRGLAAVIMLQGHTFHSFIRPDERSEAPYILSQFLGGQAAAIFLFLTGITYGLGMNRREHLSPWQRVTSALKRARYLFVLAILFRVQAWLFGLPNSSWTDLLRVDVLNLMGATAALLAILALYSGLQRVRMAAFAGILIAVLSPVASSVNASLGLPWLLKAYLIPSNESFSVMPWGAYLAFGLAAGSAIPLVPRDAWSRVMQWTAIAGFGLVFGGRFFSDLPFSLYEQSDFWLNSPGLVACKMGVTFLLSAGAFLWTEYFSRGWSWVRQLGTTSLAVYWVHIELTYGRWFWKFKENLHAWQCVLAASVLIVLMVGMSLTITNWSTIRDRIRARLFGEPYGDELLETAEPEPVPVAIDRYR